MEDATIKATIDRTIENIRSQASIMSQCLAVISEENMEELKTYVAALHEDVLGLEILYRFSKELAEMGEADNADKMDKADTVDKMDHAAFAKMEEPSAPVVAESEVITSAVETQENLVVEYETTRQHTEEVIFRIEETEILATVEEEPEAIVEVPQAIVEVAENSVVSSEIPASVNSLLEQIKQAESISSQIQAKKEITKQEMPKPSSRTPDIFSVLEDIVEQYEPTLNDRLASNNNCLNTAVKHQITDLKAAIGINEKFLFINELFKGNMKEYTDVILSLNEATNREAASQLLAPFMSKYSWNEKSVAYMTLNDFLVRKFDY